MSNETLTCICCGSNTVNTGEGWAHCQACYCEWQPHMHQADRIERAPARGGEELPERLRQRLQHFAEQRLGTQQWSMAAWGLHDLLNARAQELRR